MIRFSQSGFTGKELHAACEAELSRLRLPVGGIVTEVNDAGRWSVMVTVNGRTFHFGTLHHDGFFFVEIAADREVDLTAALPPPSHDASVWWPYAFWLLERAMQSPHSGGLEPPVI